MRVWGVCGGEDVKKIKKMAEKRRKRGEGRGKERKKIFFFSKRNLKDNLETHG